MRCITKSARGYSSKGRLSSKGVTARSQAPAHARIHDRSSSFCSALHYAQPCWRSRGGAVRSTFGGRDAARVLLCGGGRLRKARLPPRLAARLARINAQGPASILASIRAVARPPCSICLSGSGRVRVSLARLRAGLRPDACTKRLPQICSAARRARRRRWRAAAPAAHHHNVLDCGAMRRSRFVGRCVRL